MKKTSSRHAGQTAFRAASDALLARMQTPEARRGMHAAFNATPGELGVAAVKAARKRRPSK
jgi:hypothetical protein